MEVSFSVYLLDDGDLPEGGELVATCKRTFEDAGYHRVELDEPVLFDGGQRYSVVVEQKAPDGIWRVTANTAANKEGGEYISQWNGGSPYYVNGVVNRGESYLYDEAAGGWSDWRDVLDALAADPGQALNALLFDYDNFSIKAYSDPVMAADADLAGLREALEEGQALLASAEPYSSNPGCGSSAKSVALSVMSAEVQVRAPSERESDTVWEPETPSGTLTRTMPGSVAVSAVQETTSASAPPTCTAPAPSRNYPSRLSTPSSKEADVSTGPGPLAARATSTRPPVEHRSESRLSGAAPPTMRAEVRSALSCG